MPGWLLNTFAVGLGGSLGAIARFWLSYWVNRWHGSPFPLGTLLVNVSGSFLLGLLSVWLFGHPQLPDWARLGIGAGLLGAFTTFSTFSLETIELLERGQLTHATLNVLANVLCCLLAAVAGFAVARWLS